LENREKQSLVGLMLRVLEIQPILGCMLKILLYHCGISKSNRTTGFKGDLCTVDSGEEMARYSFYRFILISLAVPRFVWM
jgi:hypothetical protein